MLKSTNAGKSSTATESAEWAVLNSLMHDFDNAHWDVTEAIEAGKKYNYKKVDRLEKKAIKYAKSLKWIIGWDESWEGLEEIEALIEFCGI